MEEGDEARRKRRDKKPLAPLWRSLVSRRPSLWCGEPPNPPPSAALLPRHRVYELNRVNSGPNSSQPLLWVLIPPLSMLDQHWARLRHQTGSRGPMLPGGALPRALGHRAESAFFPHNHATCLIIVQPRHHGMVPWRRTFSGEAADLSRLSRIWKSQAPNAEASTHLASPTRDHRHTDEPALESGPSGGRARTPPTP
jgi:hypothetical protein